MQVKVCIEREGQEAERDKDTARKREERQTNIIEKNKIRVRNEELALQKQDVVWTSQQQMDAALQAIGVEKGRGLEDPNVPEK